MAQRVLINFANGMSRIQTLPTYQDGSLQFPDGFYTSAPDDVMRNVHVERVTKPDALNEKLPVFEEVTINA